MKCKECKKEAYIVNKTHCLCDSCNFKRLHDGKTRKQHYYEVKLPKIKISQKKALKKRKIVLDKDREFYKLCFDNKPQICEECGRPLPNEFKEGNGSLIAIWRYSHILTKAAYPEYRHNPDNINILCLEHHQQWEFGDRKKMNIFKKNQKIIESLLNN